MDMKLVKDIIKSILISTKFCMTIHQLNNDYASIEGHLIPFEKFGYKRLEAFLRSLTDTVEIVGYGPNALVKAIVSIKSKHVSDMVQQQKFPRKYYPHRRARNSIATRAKNATNSMIARRNQAPTQLNRKNVDNCNNFTKLDKITEDFSNLSVNRREELDVTKADKEVYYEPGPTSRNGEKSISSQDSHVAAIVKPMPTSNETWAGYKVYNVYQNNKEFQKNPIETFLDVDPTLLNLIRGNQTIFSRRLSDGEAVPSYAAKSPLQNETVFYMTMPEQVMHFEDKIPRAEIPEEIMAAPFINVALTEVYSPFQFWFHHPHKSQAVSGYELMAALAKFYKPLERSQSYLIPRVLVKPGLVCAAQYTGNIWHRAEILTDVNSRDIVKVFFLDFGTVDEVEYHKIMYLHKDFGVYPALVIRGCLSDVDPTGPHWSIHATAFLLEKVTSKWLQAIVSEIDELKRIVYLTLYDNDVSEDITDKIVQLGYAEYNINWTLDNGKHRYHTREEFPTFDMIEKGLYPSLKQISAALVSEQDLESYYDTIFYNQREYSAKLRINPFNPFYCEIMEDVLKVPDKES